MVALAPNISETSSWDVLETFPNLHSRAREVTTSNCTEAPCSKSLSRVEIWLMIYDDRIRLESFTKDPIGFDGSPWMLYEYVESNPLVGIDPSGRLSSYHGASFGSCAAGAGSTLNLSWDDGAIPCDGYLIIDTKASCGSKKCPCLPEDAGNVQTVSSRYISAIPVKKGELLSNSYTVAPTFPAGPMKKTCGSRSVQMSFALVCSNTLPGKLEDSGKWKPLPRDDKRCFSPPGISIDLSDGGNPPPMTFADETPTSIGLSVNYCCCNRP